MVISDVLNLHVYPVSTEITGAKQIPISHVCSTKDIESKDFPVDKNLSQVYSTNEDVSKSVIVNGRSTEKIKSECTHKSINKKK